MWDKIEIVSTGNSIWCFLFRGLVQGEKSWTCSYLYQSYQSVLAFFCSYNLPRFQVQEPIISITGPEVLVVPFSARPALQT